LKLRIYHESTHSKQEKAICLIAQLRMETGSDASNPRLYLCFSPSRFGVTAEVVVLNSAMRGCERSGRWIEALMLLEDTKVLGADEVSILI